MTSSCTCDTKPSVGMFQSDRSAFIAAIASIGRIFALSRSKITSRGDFARIDSSTCSAARSKYTSAPRVLAAVSILMEKKRSSTTATIIRSGKLRHHTVGPLDPLGLLFEPVPEDPVRTELFLDVGRLAGRPLARGRATQRQGLSDVGR